MIVSYICTYRYIPGTRQVTDSLRICTQKERIHQMERICAQRPYARAKQWMSPKDNKYIVDKRHKLLICWMAKAGCTAMKALVLEAAGYNITEKELGHHLTRDHYLQSGLRQFKNLTQRVAQDILGGNGYSKQLLVRHPFERLLSTYRGKVVDTKSDYRWMGISVLKHSFPNLFKFNKTLRDLNNPQSVLGAPTFAQFMQWIYDTKFYDTHWSLILENCHPCAMRWDVVMRLETIDQDSKHIVKLLKPDVPYDKMPLRHTHQDHGVENHMSLILPDYNGIEETIIDYFLELYGIDMEMFGYHWNKTTKTASCLIQTDNGPCC